MKKERAIMIGNIFSGILKEILLIEKFSHKYKLNSNELWMSYIHQLKQFR